MQDKDSIKSTRPRILAVTDVPFWKRNRGSARRIDSLLGWLSCRFPVTVCQVGQFPVGQWDRAIRELPMPLTGPGQPALWQRWLNRLVSPAAAGCPPEVDDLADPGPVELQDFRSPAIEQYVTDQARQEDVDVVLIEYVMFAWLAERIREQHPRARIVVDTHDVMHLRKSEFERVGLSHWLEIDRASETAALSGADAVIAIQQADARELSRMLPDRRVLLAGWACPAEPAPPRSSADRPVTIGFLGSRGAANRISLEWFLRNSWPRLRERTGQPLCLLIGGPLDPVAVEQTELAQIRFAGAVADPDDFYRQLDIAINPAQIHSGFKIKSLEALARGVPLVTTAAGAAGLEPAIGQGAVVADGPAEFARQLSDWVADAGLRHRLAEAAGNAVRQHFAPDVVYAQLARWLDAES